MCLPDGRVTSAIDPVSRLQRSAERLSRSVCNVRDIGKLKYLLPNPLKTRFQLGQPKLRN
jgi:hypothetical protein